MSARGIGIAGLLFLLLGPLPGLAQDEDMDDILGGFEEDDGLEVDRDAISDTEERWWDLSGSVEASASLNYRSHQSVTKTNYGGLQRLRNRLNLQFDAELPAEWKARIEGWAFYDLAYLLNGRDSYTRSISMRCFIQPEEIANAVTFLCSPAGAKISGQALSVDGHTESLSD